MVVNEQNCGMTVGRIEFGPTHVTPIPIANGGIGSKRIMYRSIIVHIIKHMRELEEFIWNNEEKFLQEFVRFNVDNCNDLTSVSFNSENCHFKWVSFEGQHFSDSIKLFELQNWIDKMENKNVR